MNIPVKKLETDVLVIGGGGAGVTAAVAASRSKADVIIISKGEVGNSGNTIMIGGSYAMDGESAFTKFGIKEADPTLDKTTLFESIVKDGFFLSDQNMVRQFVEESPDIVYEVKKWADKAGQNFKFMKPASWSMSGRAMGRALQYGLNEEKEIRKLNDVIMIDLIKKDNKVSGAVGLDIYRGEIIQINAKSVILATGGFQPFSLKNTNSDMTGDGIAMAFRAGAKVADMEFLLFLTTALEPNEIKGSILPIMFTISDNFKYDAVDKNGAVIKIHPEMKKVEVTSELCKLMHLYYFGKVISEGNGTHNGGIYFDFNCCTDEEIDRLFDDLVDYFKDFYKHGYYHGDSIEGYRDLAKDKKRLEIGLGNEYTIGGIYINEKMESTVSGLFAAGECASGVFGANRVADAVTEMMVQGYKAGITAAEYSKEKTVADNSCDDILDKIYTYMKNSDGISPNDVNKKIEEISDKGLSYFRNEKDLKEAIQNYEKLEIDFKNVTVKNKDLKYNYELVMAIQAENRLMCSKLAAVMAEERKESRGLHLRSDYPYVDNEKYLARTFAQLSSGNKVDISKRRPIVDGVNLPEPNREDYIEFILDNEMGLENMGHENE